MNSNEFGENLRKVRRERGFTQETLANEIMVCHQSVSKWETGEAMPQLKWIYKIAEALKVNPKDLI